MQYKKYVKLFREYRIMHRHSKIMKEASWTLSTNLSHRSKINLHTIGSLSTKKHNKKLSCYCESRSHHSYRP